MDEDSGCVIWDTCPSDKEADWCRFIKILDCFFFQSILVEKSNLRKWPASILRRKKNFFCRVTPSSHTLCQGCVSYQIIAYFTRSKKLINDGVKCTIQRWRATPAQVAQARGGCQCQTTVTITPRPLTLPSLFGIWLPPTLSTKPFNISVEISHPGLFSIYGILCYMLTTVAFHNIAKVSHYILFCKWNHTIQSHLISKSTLYCM